MSLFIGTSLGKCLKDLLVGTVKEHEVLVIVTNTMCPTLDRLMDVVDQYYYDYGHRPDYDLSAHSLEDAKSLAQRLFESGKLHQPRCHETGDLSRGNAHNLKDTWYDIIPSAVAGDLADNHLVTEAFERYRALTILLK